VVAEAPRAGFRSCLRLARYVAIACLRFPLLLRRPVSNVGLGWVGCCAARCRVDVRCSRRLRCPRVCRWLSLVKRKVQFSVESSVVAAVLSLLSPMSPYSYLRPLPMSKWWFNAVRLRRWLSLRCPQLSTILVVPVCCRITLCIELPRLVFVFRGLLLHVLRGSSASCRRAWG